MEAIYSVLKLVTANGEEQTFDVGQVIFFPEKFNPMFYMGGAEIHVERLTRIEYAIVAIDLENQRSMTQLFYHDLKKEVDIRAGEMVIAGGRGAQMKTMPLAELFEIDDVEGEGWQFIN